MIRKRLRLFIWALTLVFCAGTAWAVDPAPDSVPMTLLITMAEKIAKAPKFSVTMRMGYDVVQDNGQKIEFGEIRKIFLERPDKLRVEVLQSNGDESGLVFDGENITQFSRTHKVYGRLGFKGNLDSMVRYVVARLGTRVPLARMLVTTFPDEIERLSRDVVYVERDVLDVPMDHLAGRTDDVDYQVWIDDSGLPRRIVLTYVNAPGQPQFWARFTEWKLDPQFDPGTFSFSPPEGFEEVPFVIPVATSPSESDDNGTGSAPKDQGGTS